MQHAIGYAFAAVIGLSLGILGGGGSILTVPIFVYAMGYAPKVAIAMSLPVVGATSLVGAIGHWRAGSFDLRAALAFGPIAMIGALMAARFSVHVAGLVQLALLGLVMIVAAVVMLRGARMEPPPPGATRPRIPVLLASTGLGVGIITGLVGIGGGFLFVPALVLLAGLPIKTAVGTSLLVIAMNTAAGALGYQGQVSIPWTVVGVFTAIAIAGSLAGARVVRYVPQGALRRAFAYFLFAMAAFILYQNRSVLVHPRSALRPSSASTSPR
jgi:uncharacterized membrane protein YfcA